MNRLLLAITMLICSAGFSQDSSNNVRWEDTSATKKALDNTQHFLDSMKNAEISKDVARGLENLMRYQKEQRAKQKKQAILYIGLGIFFLIVLIVGLMRRSKASSGK